MALQILKSRIAKEEFFPGVLSFFTNPYYITRRSLANNLSAISPRITGTVLDFGCGSKPYQSLFVNASSYVGVDIELSGHDHATSNVDFFYDGKKLPFLDQEFDNIVSFETFEHVINLPEILPELARVVKTGGSIMVTVPFVFPEHETPYDFRRFTAIGLKALLEENGFDAVEVNRYPSAILTVIQMYIHYIFAHLSPNNSAIKTAMHLILSVPAQCIAYLFNTILPGGNDFYIGTLIVARKR